MRPVNEKLRKDLLEAGKREFMENGFRGASLKSIAASLGVTTGAIYRYYTDKEALFDGLVREPAQELVERYRTLQQTFAGRSLEEQLQKLPEVPDKEASWMMDFLYLWMIVQILYNFQCILYMTLYTKGKCLKSLQEDE